MSKLLEALHSGRRDQVDELLAQDPELDVFEAAALGRADRLRDLLADDPARANAYGDDGFQPLGLASFYGHVEAARVLLEHDADPNTLARNQYIQTNALHAAVAAENKDEPTRYELAQLLLDHGADANLRQGTDDFRPIDAARQNGDERLERLLKERGASD
jgi:ankyrin repeat protein